MGHWDFTLAVLFFTQSAAPSSWLEMNNFIGDLMAFSASGPGQLLKCTNNQSLRAAWENVVSETPAPKSCYPAQTDLHNQNQRKNMASNISSHPGQRIEESNCANCDEQQGECIATVIGVLMVIVSVMGVMIYHDTAELCMCK